MNEAAWDACEDPRKMLEWIRPRASDRKLRLLACAYWSWDEEVYQYETGMAGALEFVETWAETGVRPEGYPSEFPLWHPLLAARAFDSASWTVRGSRGYAFGCGAPTEEEHEQHRRLVREIFGNPFRPATLAPNWLTWEDGLARGLAQVMHRERDFERMPVLGDMLEDAGCDDEAILSHCRGAGPHVRGCWVVDLLLGKT
jgi:hypothetical protein